MKNKVIFIVGPTAVGKTDSAIQLAKKINAEIVSCDSMQVYSDINILSSKSKVQDLALVKHHLLNTVNSSEEYDVARYAKEATGIIRNIILRDKVPLVVGGTGLYMTVLLDGIFEDNKSNLVLRDNLYEEAHNFGSRYLYEKLTLLDEETAAKIHVNDTKKIVRALEVCLTHNEKFSDLRKARSGISKEYDITIFGLNMKRDLLYKRIEKRVDEMIGFGAIDEVKRLTEGNLSKTASACLGVKQIRGYLSGDYSKEKAIELLKRDSRHYAKRQLTWFRRDKRIEWIEITDLSREDIVEKIYRELS